MIATEREKILLAWKEFKEKVEREGVITISPEEAFITAYQKGFQSCLEQAQAILTKHLGIKFDSKETKEPYDGQA